MTWSHHLISLLNVKIISMVYYSYLELKLSEIRGTIFSLGNRTTFSQRIMSGTNRKV